MKSVIKLFGIASAVTSMLLLSSGSVNAQSIDAVEASGSSLWVSIVISLVVYLVLSFALYKIAQKVGVGESAWWAFVPVLNFFIILKMAEVSYLWVLLFFIPFVNLVVVLYAWTKILANLGKPSWHVVLFLIPFVNFVYLLMLGYGSDNKSSN